MNGLVPSSELDHLLSLGYGFMGAKSGHCDWTIRHGDISLEIQAQAKGHDSVVGLFRIYTVADPKKGLMSLAPGVTLKLTVKLFERGKTRKAFEILFEKVFDKLDDFMEHANYWVIEWKMKLELLDTLENMP